MSAEIVSLVERQQRRIAEEMVTAWFDLARAWRVACWHTWRACWSGWL